MVAVIILFVLAFTKRAHTMPMLAALVSCDTQFICFDTTIRVCILTNILFIINTDGFWGYKKFVSSSET